MGEKHKESFRFLRQGQDWPPEAERECLSHRTPAAERGENGMGQGANMVKNKRFIAQSSYFPSFQKS